MLPDYLVEGDVFTINGMPGIVAVESTGYDIVRDAMVTEMSITTKKERLFVAYDASSAHGSEAARSGAIAELKRAIAKRGITCSDILVPSLIDHPGVERKLIKI